ncbi:MAG: hypothetical protein IAF58_13485, partial [Leptolyngbya sp.]|nr:hypothetical protein [Candidatus Melainabacteria bacterium]
QDREAFILRMNFDQPEDMIAMDPDIFFIIDHYKNYEWVLVRMAQISPSAMRELLEISHQSRSIRKSKLGTRKSNPHTDHKSAKEQKVENDDTPSRNR